MKIKIKYCTKYEKVIERNFNLIDELPNSKLKRNWVHPESFSYQGWDEVNKTDRSILLFCGCGMWRNEDKFKTIEFDVDEEEFDELSKGKEISDILIKKHIMLANLK